MELPLQGLHAVVTGGGSGIGAAIAVLWLCRPGAEAVTGQAISVSGGEVMN
jgi:NAD(P)-dependent dehydrogenase (short-subunit alcohol dehydrogenase family)